MSDKGKERDDSDDAIEKKNIRIKVSVVGVLLSVLGLFSVLQTVAIIVLLLQEHADPRVDQHEAQLTRIEAEIGRIEKVTQSAEAYNQHAEVLEERLNRMLKQTDLNNYAEVRALLLQQEANYQQFIAALQQGMYDLSRMVRGSRTWYEIYKEDLDRVAAASRERYIRLQDMTPAASDN